MRNFASGLFTAAVLVTAVTACSSGPYAVAPTGGSIGSGTHELPAASHAASLSTLSSCSTVATEDPGSTAQIQQVSAVGTNDMYFASVYPTDGAAGPLSVSKYSTGGGAIALPNPFTSLVYYAYLKAISDNDIWIGAYTQGNPALAIAHWNGSVWTQIQLQGSYSATFVPRGLSALATNDVWLSGFIYVPGGTRAALAHWNGSSFAIAIASPYYGVGGPVVELGPGNVLTTFEDNSNAYAMQWNGSHVTFHLLPPAPGQSGAGATPLQISASGPMNIWITGTGASSPQGRIWRFNGQWQPYLYTASGPTLFEGITALDATRAVVTSFQGSPMYGYSGTDRFHAITNTLGGGATGPSELVPGTETFWVPVTMQDGRGIVKLMSCN